MNNILYSLFLLFFGVITTQTDLNAQAALKFDGTDDRVALPDALATDITASSTNALTIEYWFKGMNIQSVFRLQPPSGGYIVTGWNGGGPTSKHIISTDGGLSGVNVTNAAAAVPINPTDGNWHHVAVTWQRNTVNGFKSYLDGILQDQRNSADVALPSLSSGCFLGADRGSYEFTNGAIDELRIWTRALPPCEILNNKNCELGSGQTGLLAYYKFNQSSGTTLTNGTTTTPANRYDGTLTAFELTGTNSNWISPSNVTVGTTCTPLTFVTPSVSIVANPGNTITAGTNVTFTATPTNGGTMPNYQWKKNNVNVGTNQATYANASLGNGDVITCVLTPSSEICALPATSTGITMVVSGSALNFDGVNDYVSLPNSFATALTSPSNSAITIEYWFKGTNPQSVLRLQSNAAPPDFIISGWSAVDGFKHAISTETGGLHGILMGPASTDWNAQWNHIAMTWQRNTLNGFKSYLNGVLVEQRNSTDNALPPMTSGAFLGSDRGGAEYTNGSVDELRIWTRALPQCEIVNNMNCKLGSGQTNLLACYKFNENAGTSLTDGANSYTGTLTNFALTGTNSNWATSSIATATCSPISVVTASLTLDVTPSGTITSTTNATFTATPTNGGTTPIYQWRKNNMIVGTNQATYATTGLLDGDIVTCILTPNGGICALPVSESITISATAPMSGATLNFDGANDFVALPNTLTAAVANASNAALTIEYRFKGTNLQSAVRFQGAGGYIIAGYGTGTFQHVISTDGGAGGGVSVGPVILNGTTWNHIAMTWQRNTVNGFKSYLNGVLVEQRDAADVPLPVLTNGGTLGSDNGNAEYTNGSIDEVRIWNRALPRCEILNNKDCELGSGQTGLLAYYKFNQNSSTTLTDDATNAHTYAGTLNNFALGGNTSSNWLLGGVGLGTTCTPVTLVTPSVNVAASPSGAVNGGTNVTFTATPTSSGTTPSYQWRKNNVNVGANQATYADASLNNGDVITSIVSPSSDVCGLPAIATGVTMSVNGAALNLDGTNDYIALPNALTTAMTLPSNTALTIEYWFKGTNPQSAVRLQSNASPPDFIITGWSAVDGFKHAISTETGGLHGLLVGPAATNWDAQWNHIAMTWQRNTVNGFKSYLNGVLVEQRNSTNNPLPTITSGGYIGSDRGTAEFTNGSIDELRIWNRALAQSELQNNKNCELGSGQTGLLAYYKFNQKTGTSLSDGTANNYAATLTNFTFTGATSNWNKIGGIATGNTCVGMPLSIDLLAFKATPSVSGNLLTWITANEVNNKGFQIERLMGNGEWLILGFVNAQGKSATYDFTDKTPLNASYYRLRQIDNDGKETLSKVVSVLNKENHSLKVYPNPVSNMLIVETDNTGDFSILNLLGQKVISGKAAQRIDVSALPLGTYFLKIGEERVKFVRQ
jgi:Concanavalin A-like lectin/glucanases superfamily/Secretion system C-terminal sorting domain